MKNRILSLMVKSGKSVSSEAEFLLVIAEINLRIRILPVLLMVGGSIVAET